MNAYVSKNAISHYTEGETFSTKIQPAFSSNADTTNTYGTWSIHCYSSVYQRDITELYKGFDLNNNSNAELSMKEGEDASYELVCPVAIKPTKVSITHRYLKNGYFQGYNPINKTWETLGTFTGVTSKTSTSLTPTTNNYYTKFRLYTDEYYSSSYTKLWLYLLVINQGVIGVPVYEDISTKVEKVYVGVNDLSKKVSKIYAGVGGLSKLVWSCYPKYFNEIIFPDTAGEWEKISVTDFTATNSFGTWEATSSGNSSTDTPNKVFIRDNTITGWISNSGSTGDYRDITLDCPVSIKPTKIFLQYRNCGNATNPGYFQGYNPTTQAWEDIITLEVNTNILTKTITVSPSNFYNKFRVYTSRRVSNTPQDVRRFYVLEGYYQA